MKPHEKERVMKQLEGKKAIVTGGTSGIGLSTAKLLLQQGAQVIVTGTSEKGIAAARSELAGAVVLKSDASSVRDIEALAREAEQRFGKVDVVFLNAGIGTFEPFDGVTEDRFDRQFAVNVRGPFFAVQKLRPILAEGASVIVNTTVVDEKGWPNTSVYAASKAALRSLVRTLSVELAPAKIRVNAVSPGPIETPIFGKLGLSEDGAKAMAANISSRAPFGRFGRPEEIANAVLFLASSGSSYVTGAEILVDGGIGNT
jgi:NAD(P)-dependent dehydrogenase (short-subunit alcohol dehydrogenase family)